jgi:hypothetical protein
LHRYVRRRWVPASRRVPVGRGVGLPAGRVRREHRSGRLWRGLEGRRDHWRRRPGRERLEPRGLQVQERPLRVQERPLRVQERPLRVQERPLRVQERPLRVQERPLRVLERPLRVLEPPPRVRGRRSRPRPAGHSPCSVRPVRGPMRRRADRLWRGSARHVSSRRAQLRVRRVRAWTGESGRVLLWG